MPSMNPAATLGPQRPLAWPTRALAGLVLGLALACSSSSPGGGSTTTTITPSMAPSITAQPQGLAVTPGTSVTFSVTATGTDPLHYSWKKDGAAVGGDAAVCTIAAAQAPDAGSYVVAVANAAGSDTSQPAVLTVETLAISAQPLPQTVNEGSTATFTVAATGVPAALTCQWQTLVNDAWQDIPGATGVSYTTPAAQAQDGGSSYRCALSNGVVNVTSDPALLVVNWLHVLTQPLALSAARGQAVTFTVAGAGYPASLAYQWQRNNGSGWADLSGAGTASYGCTAAAGDNGAAFRCRITNGILSVASLPATLATGIDLGVTVTGLPEGVSANVTVSGPGGFSQVLAGTQTLLVQQTGTYTLAAAPVEDPGQPPAGGVLSAGPHQIRHPWCPVQTLTVTSAGAAASVVYPLPSFTVAVPDAANAGGTVPMTFMLVPAGTFIMGSQDSSDLNYTCLNPLPAHAVTFATAFYLAKFPCTQRQWRAAMGTNPSVYTTANGSPDPLELERPVESVDWNLIRTAGTGFLDVLNGLLPGFGFRLPSEAEYEYSLRAGTSSPWFFGSYEPRAQAFAWNGPARPTHPVGTRAQNPWGLCDLTGNVVEWCEDDAHDGYAGAPVDGSAWVDAPTRASDRVVRGVGITVEGGRSSVRGDGPASSAYDPRGTGFRLAVGVPVTTNPSGPGLCLTLPGLANGVAGAVAVTGPHGFSANLTGPGPLTGLAEGTYTFTAATVYDTSKPGLGLANGGDLGPLHLAIQPMRPVMTATVAAAAGTVDVSVQYADPALQIFGRTGVYLGSMVFIPAGSFTMGSPATEQGRSSIEDPAHAVTFQAPFFMFPTPVTQGIWGTVMGNNPSKFSLDPVHPVEQVSWNDATAFLAALNALTDGTRPLGMAFRLPTEAEWEYAARAGSTTAYYWGEGLSALPISSCAWYAADAGGTTHPVALKAPNAWGLSDMSGNVWEWCQDWFGPYPADPASDPVGPEYGDGRVMRGGGFSYDAPYLRSASRAFAPADTAFDALGFRVVLVGGAPVIVAGPANQTITSGDPFTFTVAATGTGPLHYQWKLNGGAFGPDAGQLTIASADVSYAGTYTVTVSNAVGSATSGPALLTVNPPPAQYAPYITTPPAPQVVTEGDPVTFTVVATGTPTLHYQWQKDGVNIGSDADHYTIAAVKLTDAGKYSVTVTNNSGNWASGPAALTVKPAVVITAQPIGTMVLVGEGFTLTVAATGSGTLHYQWMKNSGVIGSDASQLTVTHAQTADSGSYTVKVYNALGQATSVPAAVSVTATPVAPAITAQPATQTVSSGFPATLSVVATGTQPLHYQWNLGGNPVGGDASSYVLASVQPKDGGTYTVTVTNGGGSLISDPAVLSVQGGPSFTLAPGVSLALTSIPAGTFTMGATAAELSQSGGNYTEELPQHSVTISQSFYMGTYTVTQAQWLAVMGNNPSYFTVAAGNVTADDLTRPVEQVTWNDIAGPAGFLEALNTLTATTRPAGVVFRLPTEAEWEYAARAGTTTRFYWGDDPNWTDYVNYAWWSGNSGGITHGTGSLLTPNLFGLYNMSGNVVEWCQDWYSAATYTSASVTDPLGPATGLQKILRGGAIYFYEKFGARSAMRIRWTPDTVENIFGFRLVLGQPRTP